jgi:tripartite-type tricarboxylate transporter receptor subunit TctC
MNIARILVILLTFAFAAPLAAQGWLSKPVTIVVGFTAGTTLDVLARYLADNLRERTGQSFIVELKPGVFGNLAAQHVARARPDGATVLLAGNATHVVNVHLFKELGYDPVKDFAPVTTVVSLGFVLVTNPGVVPVNSMPELTDYIKLRPGKLSYGAGASSARIATELYLQVAGGLDVAFVPYKGSTQAINDLLGGRIHFMFADVISGMHQARAGKLRALAVTNANRVSCAPEIPTIAEAAVSNYDLGNWHALYFPARTPIEIAQKLADLSNAVWTTDKGREFLRNQCLDPYPGSPDRLARLVENDTVRWGRVIRAARIEPQ